MEDKKSWRWLWTALVLVAGCAGPANDPNPNDPNELAATVGPEGGTLRGEIGSQFEGVELAIPEGALAAPTPVRIVATADATPLPPLAMRVGTPFAIEPADVVLASPATLTLPVSTDTVQHFAQSDGDVKVWLRDGDGWKLQEPDATAAGTVTIPISSFTTAAAGIRLVIAGPTCAICRLIVPAETCTSVTGFCSRSLGIPNPQPHHSTFAVDASAVYYPIAPSPAATPSVAIARLDLSSAAVTSSSALALATFTRGLAVDTDGSIWAGLDGHLGNARFPFKGAVVRYDFDGASYGQGALRTPAGTLVRFFSGMSRSRVGGVNALFGPSRVGAGFFGVDSSPGFDAYWVAQNGGNVLRVDAKTGALIATVQMVGTSVFGAFRIAAASDGTASQTPSLATLYMAGSVGALAHATKGSTLHAVGLPFVPWDIDIDGSGGVWIVGNTAEIHYLTPDEGLLSAPLTSADLSSLAYYLAMPITVRALPDGSCVVLLNSGEFLVIRRAT